MKIPIPLSLFLLNVSLISLLTVANNAFASLSIESLNTPVTIDFTGFTGAGFAPEPSEGQLDSDTWAVSGFDDPDLDFGGTAIGGDFARGSSSGGETTGGIWAFDTGGGDVSLGIQPGGSDWNPGSFTLKLQNNSGVTISSLDVSYSIYVYNDENRSNSFNFSHSADNSSFIDVSSLDFASPELKDDPASWVETSRSTTLSGLSIADGADYYFRWSGNDISGGGSRDQFGLDDISVSAVPEPAHFGLIFGSVLLLLVGRRIRSK